jgi:hypothetical protein
MAVDQELLLLGFENNITDAAGRHALSNSGVTFSTDCKIGTASAYFNGSAYLSSSDNKADFNLGATPRALPANWIQGFSPSSPNNNFTIDCWVKPEVGSGRYYPICSSFQLYYGGTPYKTGWVLQIDTATGKLQMIGYAGGDWLGSVFESTFILPFGEWNQIIVMSWPIPGGFGAPSAKAMYKNGQPDLGGWAYISEYMVWSNCINSEYAPFYVGLGPSSQFTNPGESWASDLAPGYRFRGKIDNLRICLGNRFPTGDTVIQVVPTDPPGITTTTTTTTTTETTTTTTTLTTTGTTTLTTTTTTQSTSTASTTARPYPVIADGSTNTSTVDCIPSMITYDVPAPFVITASSENIPGIGYSPPWHQAYYAFDDNEATVVDGQLIFPKSWVIADKDVTNFPQWICVDVGDGLTKPINKYRLRANNLVGFPRNWKLRASSDNQVWTVLHSFEDFPTSQILIFQELERSDWAYFYQQWLTTAESGEWRADQVWWTPWFTFTNDIFYRYYQIYVDVVFTTSAQPYPPLTISQIELVESEPVGGTTTSSSTTTVSTTTFTSTTQPLFYVNVTNDGYALANHAYPNYDAEKAFDRNIGTYWICDPYSGPPYWIMYYWLDRSYAVDCYQIYADTLGGPTSWIFQGSFDGETWVDLDTQTDVEIDGLWTGYAMNYMPYMYYRIYILSTQSQRFGTRIDDIQLFVNSKNYTQELGMHWIGYDFTPRQVNVGRYCIYVQDGQTFDTWKLQASDDGILWTDVDCRMESSFVGWGCFEVTGNITSFKKWRVLIVNWDRNSEPGVVELELFSAP